MTIYHLSNSPVDFIVLENVYSVTYYTTLNGVYKYNLRINDVIFMYSDDRDKIENEIRNIKEAIQNLNN